MPADAFTLSIRLLSRREHSGDELRQKLRARDCSGEEIEETLRRLREKNLQSDRRFCDSYINQQRGRFGDFRLRAELKKRGIDDALIDEALAAAQLPAESARALAVLQKKYPQGVSAADAAGAAPRFLYSRGFSAGSIRAALAEKPAEESA